MRMSPPPPGVFQRTPDPGRPDQVPWTLWHLHDRIHIIIDESLLLLECYNIPDQVILIRILRRPHDPYSSHHRQIYPPPGVLNVPLISSS